MGHFSSGTEGMDYQERYCFRCQHWSDDEGCPVWDAHYLYCGDACAHKNAAGLLGSNETVIKIGDGGTIQISENCYKSGSWTVDLLALRNTLDMLIPRSENGLWNEQCRMFKEQPHD